MLSDSKSYGLKKLKTLGMLAQEMQRLVYTTLQKPRWIIQTFAEALHYPVGDSIKVSKPNNES